MAHIHSIYDTDTHFVINPSTRKITFTGDKTVLMQNDHNSERYTFELPRFIEGHDMLNCDEVQIHYINSDSSNSENQSSDVYSVTDIQVSPDSDDVVIGSWLISSNVTKYCGTVVFSIRFVCYNSNKKIDYQWFTEIYTGIKVSKAIYNSSGGSTNNGATNPDVIDSWKQQFIDAVAPYAEQAQESAEEAEKSEANAKKSETNAAAYANSAAASANNAIESAAIAGERAAKALQSEINVKESEILSTSKATESFNNATLSKSWAVGDTGVRDGEDTDNSKYYAQTANSLYTDAIGILDEAKNTLIEAGKEFSGAGFTVNFNTGCLEYTGRSYNFSVNTGTGNLEWEATT